MMKYGINTTKKNTPVTGYWICVSLRSTGSFLEVTHDIIFGRMTDDDNRVNDVIIQESYHS